MANELTTDQQAAAIALGTSLGLSAPPRMAGAGAGWLQDYITALVKKLLAPFSADAIANVFVAIMTPLKGQIVSAETKAALQKMVGVL